MRIWKSVTALALCAVAVACATPDTQLPDVDATEQSNAAEQQRRFVLTSRLDAQKRVRNVAYRVLRANADLCKENVGPEFGLYILQGDGVETEYQATARALWNLGPRPRVMHVVPNSPAARAGIQAGDIVTAVNGTALGDGSAAAQSYATALVSIREGQTVRFAIERAGMPRQVSMVPSKSCSHGVLLSHDSAANAFTDGKQIVVNEGILRIAQSDEELALVIGHELAHITKGHIDKQKQNAIIAGTGGFVLDVAFAVLGVNTQGAFTEMSANAGRQAFSHGFEKEADYVGSYHMARAGYDTTGVEKFWRRMAAEDPKIIAFAGTHPTSSERYALIAKTHTEILAKRSASQPLVPNLDPDRRRPVSKRKTGRADDMK